MRSILLVLCLVISVIVCALANTSFAQSLWITSAELASLPTSGMAWDALKSTAQSGDSVLNLSDQNDSADMTALACALVYARTGDFVFRLKSEMIIFGSIETENGGRTLALGRNLAPIVIAADLLQLSGADKTEFSTWLSAVRKEDLSGRTLISTHEDRPNNWGTMCGGSRIAAALYLGDTADLERCWKVYKGYCGDRTSYAGFEYGDLIYQWNPAKPVGINPQGAIRKSDGLDIDGCMPDDARRGPLGGTGYPWEGLQGVLVMAELLHKAGYPAYLVGGDLNGNPAPNMAVLRAVEWLYRVAKQPASGDDRWQIHLINARYGSTFAESLPAQSGKIMGFTDWTHDRVLSPVPDGDPDPTPTPEPDPIPPCDLKLSTSSIAFTYTVGESLPSASPVSVTCDESHPFTAVKSEPWVVLSANGGTTPSTIHVAANTTILAPGSYSATVMFASPDASGSVALSIALTVNPAPTPPDPEPEPIPSTQVFDIAIAAGTDDAEQRNGGSIATPGGDLLFGTYENVAVGLRFSGLGIPKNAAVTKAYLQFQANDATSDVTNLTVFGRLIANAPTFSSSPKITQMAKTSASVPWSVPPWKTKGLMTTDQRTPDLSAIVQQIIGEPDWSPGNSLAFIVTGTGRREANSFESGSGRIPAQLHVEYTVTP